MYSGVEMKLQMEVNLAWRQGGEDGLVRGLSISLAQTKSSLLL